MPAEATVTAFVSWIASAGAATATALGATGATATVIATAVNSAIVGSVVGAARASLKGEDMLQGALKGAGVGAIGGGLVGGVSALAGEAGGSAALGAQASADAATGGVIPSAAPTGVSELPQSIYGGAPGSTPVAPPVGAAPGVIPQTPGFMQQHGGEVIGRTIAGAGEGLMASSGREKDIEYAMERDRLNRESRKIGGLGGIQRPGIPKIGAFNEKPQWQQLFK